MTHEPTPPPDLTIGEDGEPLARWATEPVADSDLAPSGTHADCHGTDSADELPAGHATEAEGMDGVALPDDDEVAELLAGEG